MKESISYTFLLNIIILFIFTCAAIIMGIFSYYKAFRANTIISETIEKYEGYNCLSKEEIARKLNNIGYNTPFKVNCKTSDGKCESNEELGYKVISYNLDFDTNNNTMEADMSRPGKSLIYGEDMNSVYQCDSNGCATNKHYQYGIYTYMYVEMPVISSILKIPFFSKTSTMYEFRNFYVSHSIDGDNQITNIESVFDELYTREKIDKNIYAKEALLNKETEDDTGEISVTKIKSSEKMASIIFSMYADLQSLPESDIASPEFMFMEITGQGYKNYRTRAIIEKLINERKIDGRFSTGILAFGYDGARMRRDCGYKIDFSKIN